MSLVCDLGSEKGYSGAYRELSLCLEKTAARIHTSADFGIIKHTLSFTRFVGPFSPYLAPSSFRVSLRHWLSRCWFSHGGRLASFTTTEPNPAHNGGAVQHLFGFLGEILGITRNTSLDITAHHG